MAMPWAGCAAATCAKPMSARDETVRRMARVRMACLSCAKGLPPLGAATLARPGRTAQSIGVARRLWARCGPTGKDDRAFYLEIEPPRARQAHLRRRALAGLAGQRESPAVQLDQPFAQRQAEPRALLLP